jgi:hypothetical protein
VRTRLLFAAGPLLVAAVTAGLVIYLARGTDGPGDPGAFMTRLVEQIASNDYAGAWLTLHPDQQRIATRDAYVTCEARSPIPGRLSSVTVLGISDERVRLAAGDGQVAGKAVRLRLSIAGAGAEPVVLTHISHAVAVGGHWTWILPTDRLAEYRAGRCPG